MFYKAMILGLNGQYEAAGKLCFSEDKKSAMMQLDPGESMDNIDMSIKIAVNSNYYEVYLGNVEKFDELEKKVYITNLVNNEKNRNEDIKVDIDYNFNIMYTDADDDIISIEVQMRDLSAGGFCFCTEAALETGADYEAVFSFLDEPMIVPFSIIRKIYGEEEKIYVYGCKFLNLNFKEEEVIRKKVFKILANKNKRK